MTYVYTAHLARDDNPDRTLCGEPWQGWQAPTTDSYELTPDHDEQPPHHPPRPHIDTIRQCQACVHRSMGR